MARGITCACAFLVYILTDPYRIVLNVSTRFYFSVYATGASCVFASSAVPSNAMHPSRSSSTQTIPGLYTTDYSLCLNGINSCCVSPPPTTMLCVFYGEPCLCNLVRMYGASLCSSVYTTTCRFAERAVLRFATGH